MIDKKKRVTVAPNPVRAFSNKPDKKDFKPSHKVGGKLKKLSKYFTFFALLLFLVFLIYLLVVKSEMISSTWVYSALGLIAGLLFLVNLYFVKKHSDKVKDFFSKFKRVKVVEEKKVVGVVVDETKKVGKEKVKSKVKPKVVLFVTFFVLGVVALLILNSRGVISFSSPYFLLSVGALFLISLVVVSLRFYRYHKSKMEIQKSVSKENISVIKKSIVAKASKYKTDLDRLYELVNEKGKLTLSDVAKGFNISIEMAEEWARILESHDLITLNYPPFGEVELCKK